MDRVGADFFRVFKQIEVRLFAKAVMLQIPIGAEDSFIGMVDLVEMDAIIYEDELGMKFRRGPIPANMAEQAKKLGRKVTPLILVGDLGDSNAVARRKGFMNVIEKKREIAILKAMGATNKGIMTIFMLQGFVIGLVGTIIGVVSVYLLSYILNTYEIIKLPADVYYLSHLPVKMKFSDFITVSVSALTISFLATIYPAWQAARLNPVEPLRYE